MSHRRGSIKHNTLNDSFFAIKYAHILCQKTCTNVVLSLQAKNLLSTPITNM